jgi:hypothetical protein
VKVLLQQKEAEPQHGALKLAVPGSSEEVKMDGSGGGASTMLTARMAMDGLRRRCGFTGDGAGAVIAVGTAMGANAGAACAGWG